MSITDLPAELLLDIFALSCVDTGYTGCSLRAVSQRFHLLCTQSGVDIQTVALCGVERMKGFQGMLDGRKREWRRVHNLFLTDRETKGPGIRLPLQDLGTSPVELSNRVLRSISLRDLRILTVDLPTWRSADDVNTPVLHHYFPFLTDLTLRGGLDVPFFTTCPSWPKLQRLHIVSHKQLPYSFGACILQLAPHLTHLRLSGVDSPAKSGNLYEVIRTYTSSPSPSTFPNSTNTNISDPPTSDHKLPASVNTFIIAFDTCFQFTHPIHSGRRQMNYLQNARAIQQLGEEYHARIRKEATSSHGHSPVALCDGSPLKSTQRKLVVHPTPPMRSYDDMEDVAKASYDRLRAEWEDRVQGGEAGWDAVPSSTPWTTHYLKLTIGVIQEVSPNGSRSDCIGIE